MASALHEWCNDVSDGLMAAVSSVEERKPPTVQARAIEIDLWIEPESLPEVGAFLNTRGFVPLRSLEENTHRFFLAHRPGAWCKVDAKLRTGALRRQSNLWWALRRRRGAILALVGADGAGKSSTIEMIRDTSPFGVRVAYLGFRRKTVAPGDTPPAGSQSAPRSSVRQIVGVGVWTMRTVRRLFPVHMQARLGRVVVCDRHPIEIEALDGTTSPVARSLRKFVVRRLLPGPDHIVLLAAPGAVLYARKGEHDPARLDEMTAALRDLVQRSGGTEIDCGAPQADVVNAVERVLLDAVADRHGVVPAH